MRSVVLLRSLLFAAAVSMLIRARAEQQAGTSVAPAAAIANGSSHKAESTNAAEPRDPEAWPLKVLVVDEATGQPIPNPSISLEWGRKTTSHAGDAGGAATIVLPNRAPSYCYLRARAPSYAPMRAFWSDRLGPDEMPEVFTFAMSKAIKVGGRVVDEDGDPVADATVFFSAGDRASRTGRRAESFFYDEVYKTDAQGRWECDLAPPNTNRGSIRVDHPNFARVSDHWSVDDNIEELRAFTYKWTLWRCFKIAGRVTDFAGKPVEGAVLAVGYFNMYADAGPFPKTDADGNYEFTRMGADLGTTRDANPHMTITAMKVGLAPTIQPVGGWEPGAHPAARFANRTIDFVLQPGRTVRIRVVDGAGNGVPRMWVFPHEWKDARPFRALAKFGMPQRTDDKGLWEWTWAPPNDEIKYGVYGNDYMDVRDYPIAAKQAVTDVTITLKRPQILTGRVIDAVTKKPIDSFVVEKGFEDGTNKLDGIHWEATEARGRNGRYTKAVTSPTWQGSYRYRVSAEGYEPKITGSVKFEEGERTLDFELTPLPIAK